MKAGAIALWRQVQIVERDDGAAWHAILGHFGALLREESANPTGPAIELASGEP
jgi:hypothetical protein